MERGAAAAHLPDFFGSACEPCTGSGIPVLVITTDRANNLGYYSDGWCDCDAYWVAGNVFYHLRLTGGAEDPGELETVLQRLLSEI